MTTTTTCLICKASALGQKFEEYPLLHWDGVGVTLKLWLWGNYAGGSWSTLFFRNVRNEKRLIFA